MSKHTPGPWKWEDLCLKTQSDNSIYKSVLELGCGCCTSGDIEDADVCLIAAAPELLEALEDLLYQANLSEEGGWDFEQARAAIAKARGRL